MPDTDASVHILGAHLLNCTTPRPTATPRSTQQATAALASRADVNVGRLKVVASFCPRLCKDCQTTSSVPRASTSAHQQQDWQVASHASTSAQDWWGWSLSSNDAIAADGLLYSVFCRSTGVPSIIPPASSYPLAHCWAPVPE